MTDVFYIRVAGISIRFCVPQGMEIPRDLKPFLIQPEEADETYAVSSLPQPISFTQPPVYSSKMLQVYREPDGWVHVFPGTRSDAGVCMTCRLGDDHNNALLIPDSAMPRYMQNCIFSGFLVPERLLIRHRRALLHSALIRLRGKAVLFCGRSGIGKSTQASLWQDTLGAEILNGDRAVIFPRSGAFWGSGSPYCGSSGIYSPEEAPIAAIVLLEQAPENTIVPVSPAKALRTFLRETVQNTWDDGYTRSLLALLADLARSVPIYALRCRPDTEAVLLTHETIFDKSEY